MAHLTEVFPACFSFGMVRRPAYRTTVISAASGLTERNAHWTYPLHIYSCPLNNRTQTEVEDLLEYWHAAGGQANTFSLLDPGEDRSCALGDDVAQDDQTLGTAAASQTDFQLIKNYTRGGVTQVRKITRPIDSSVLVEVDSVLQTVTTHYTIDSLGVISFVTPMTGGEVVKAGFRFHVPVAFGSDDMDTRIHNYNSGFINDTSFDIIEVRE